jgi:DNA-binding NarL/FixJ family response regulator
MEGSVCMRRSVAPVPPRDIGETAYPAPTHVEENRAVDPTSPALVGRRHERDAITAALAALDAGVTGLLVLEGEPGIGKSRLLAYLATLAAENGCTVLEARASEFEADLPYGLFREALDDYLAEAGMRRLSTLGVADPGALVAALPALAALEPEPAIADRHRIHRGLRDLLERLAATHALVLCLDDVHWADPASVDALAALVHRPPAAPVLVAVAAREGQMPASLRAAFDGALRDERLTPLALAPLTEAEAAELVGDAARSIYPRTGGNPFYLEQLARAGATSPGGADVAAGDSVPPVVAAALAAELAAVGAETRRMLDAAAVVGDPFDPGLAAEAAELSEPSALVALDDLLARALVRPAGAPRRFAFRHPVVRHAVYQAAPAGWRLGAHSRAAAALERFGADPVQRAHHVEHAARAGDGEAIALLSTAAGRLQSPAPASAARYHAAALRLLPDTPEHHERRTHTRLLLADAQAAAGDPGGARETLLDALRAAGADERLPVIVALANQEWWLGGHESARRRLQVALADLPARPSPNRIRLRLALALTALMAGDLREAKAHAMDARDDARAIGDPVFELAALAGGAVASVAAAEGPDAAARLDESAAALERLTAAQLATRLPALWMHGRARRMLGAFEAALADLERGAEIASETGRERVLLILTVESAMTLVELGRLADATAAAQDGLDLARLAGNPRMLLWAHSTVARVRLAAGDVEAALRHAGEAADTGSRSDFHSAGEPGWCLGAALTAGGNAERAVPVMLDAFGGEDLALLTPADRPAGAADLVDARLAAGDISGAREAMMRSRAAAARAGTPCVVALAGRAEAAVLLAEGRPGEAAECAAAARAAAGHAPLTAARAGLIEGQARAAAGERRAARAILVEAERAFDGFGARRWRDEAVRALRGLGHRVRRPARDGAAGPLGPLTAREREIAELVASGRTNREIAAELVLSQRTIEAHLRNIYAKLGVRSRVDLTRASQQLNEAP